MFINWAKKEMHIKIVYYGPPLSGKTTNLEQLHLKLPPKKRSDLVSVKTRQDRTLFFDFMQVELGEIKGLTPKFKLYTVPGQTYYASTRKLVLKDVDGLVFVADSSIQRLAVNRRAMNDMRNYIKELGLAEDIPLVLQCNKQDLPDAVPPALLGRFLGVTDIPVLSAEAVTGVGIAETLKAIIRQVISTL